MRIVPPFLLASLAASCAAPELAAPRAAAGHPDFSRMSAFLWFERRPTHPLERARVTIGTFRGPGREAGEPVPYWFVLRRETLGGTLVERAFTSSDRCPGALAALRRAEAIAMPRPDVPHIGEDWSVITVDGVGYVLGGHARDARGQHVTFRIEALSGTAAGDWIETMVGSLSACWTPLEPDAPDDFAPFGDDDG